MCKLEELLKQQIERMNTINEKWCNHNILDRTVKVWHGGRYDGEVLIRDLYDVNLEACFDSLDTILNELVANGKCEYDFRKISLGGMLVRLELV